MSNLEEIAARRAFYKTVDAINILEGIYLDEVELKIREQIIMGEITDEDAVALNKERFSKMERLVKIQ